MFSLDRQIFGARSLKSTQHWCCFLRITANCFIYLSNSVPERENDEKSLKWQLIMHEIKFSLWLSITASADISLHIFTDNYFCVNCFQHKACILVVLAYMWTAELQLYCPFLKSCKLLMYAVAKKNVIFLSLKEELFCVWNRLFVRNLF